MPEESSTHWVNDFFSPERGFGRFQKLHQELTNLSPDLRRVFRQAIKKRKKITTENELLGQPNHFVNQLFKELVKCDSQELVMELVYRYYHLDYTGALEITIREGNLHLMNKLIRGCTPLDRLVDLAMDENQPEIVHSLIRREELRGRVASEIKGTQFDRSIDLERVNQWLRKYG